LVAEEFGRRRSFRQGIKRHRAALGSLRQAARGSR
jgi:hypothetical protein